MRSVVLDGVAAGLANFLSAVFSGIGGCALIGTSMINLDSGAYSRLSTFSAGATVLLTIVVAYRVINLVPIAALAGCMFMIVIHTFNGPSLWILWDGALLVVSRVWRGVHSSGFVAFVHRQLKRPVKPVSVCVFWIEREPHDCSTWFALGPYK